MSCASMEPGHEDREYPAVHLPFGTVDEPQWSPVMKTGNTYVCVCVGQPPAGPQWSPVMKTGNTGTAGPARRHKQHASMEPGHEDREYMGVLWSRHDR